MKIVQLMYKIIYIYMLDYFSNACIAYKILTNNIFYICVCRKKLLKIKIDQILFKIDYVTRKIKHISDITN